MCWGFTVAVRRSMSITEFAHSLGWKQAGSVQHLAASGRRLHIWTPPLADSVAQPRAPRQHVSMAVKGQAPKNSRGRHNGTTPPRRRAGDSRPPPLAFGKGSVGPSPELWSSTPDLLRPFCAMALAARQRVGLSTPGTTFSQVLPPPRRPRPRCLPPRPSANASFADRAFGALLQREPRPRAPRLSDPLGRGGRRRWCGRSRASGLPPRRRAGGPPMAAPSRRCLRIRR